MKDKDLEIIKEFEFEFEYKGESYRFRIDEVEYKNQYGLWCTLFELPISYTKYVKDKDIVEFACKLSLSAYFQGIADGKLYKEKEIRQVLGIRD